MFVAFKYIMLDIVCFLSRGVMVKAMDCGIVVSEFVLSRAITFTFRANTLGKGMNPLILQLWLNSTTTVLLGE